WLRCRMAHLVARDRFAGGDCGDRDRPQLRPRRWLLHSVRRRADNRKQRPHTASATCECVAGTRGGRGMLQKVHAATLNEIDGHGHHGESHSVFGFWLYLMTDCVLFASLFATFAVMAHQFNAGPTGKDLFDLPGVALETAALLFSSITYGFAMVAARR